jgi:peptidoglycan hydrolase CwlO-like protein
MTEKDDAVIFDERHLKSLVKKMEKLRNKIDTFKETVNDLESEFKSIQSEYFKVEKTIKQQNANQS